MFNKKNIIKILTCICAVCILSVGYTSQARADAVTDTISVKLGYFGMELSEYVTVGTYHWAELAQGLNVYEEAYSFFQGQSSTEYNVIVDSARGFSIKEFLDYANVYYGDIKSLKFYVVDHQGIQAAFDRDSLFGSRYYFEDMPGHRTVHYATKKTTQQVQVGEEPIYSREPVIDEETGEQKTDPETGELLYEDVITGYTPVYETVEVEVPDYTRITGYTFDECWNYCKNVSPMLALEDNWETFNEEYEHASSNFETLSTGSRFRLLFGQTSPTESLTSSSAKYVSCLYITLEGSPKYGEMEELDNSYGSHTVELTVSGADTNIRDALSSLIRIGSTDTNVLKITGFTVKNSDVYSDMATVTISYEIVGEGSASITAGIGKSSEMQVVSQSTDASTAGSSENTSDKTGQNTSGQTTATKLTNKNANRSEGSVEIDSSELTTVSSKGSVFVLSGGLGELLAGMEAVADEEDMATDVTEVVTEDNSEEQEERKQLILMLTCAGGLVVCAAGAGFGFTSFEIKRRRKAVFNKEK